MHGADSHGYKIIHWGAAEVCGIPFVLRFTRAAAILRETIYIIVPWTFPRFSVEMANIRSESGIFLRKRKNFEKIRKKFGNPVALCGFL